MNDIAKNRYPDWEPLLTWIALTQAGSVSKASRRLGISQAAVSQRVKALETLFDTTLLDRASRPARQTAAGKRLTDHASSLIKHADEMMNGVRRISHSKMNVVRLGCTDSFAAAGGSIIIRALSSSAREIHLWSGSTDRLEESVVQRELDLAITPMDGELLEGMKKVRLFTEPFVAVLPASFDAETFGTLDDLACALPLIRYTSRSRNGKQIDEYFARTGDKIGRTCQFDTTEPLLNLVANGLGFALTTPLCIWQARHHIPQLKIVDLRRFSRRGKAYPKLERTFFLSYRDEEFGGLADEMRSLIASTFERQVNADIVSALSLQHDAVTVVN
ncbi:LysR family transcriptional regulator (plasmid) [Burkholderia sp. SFA1]|nr:LysR family transcriptional regulator [Burkholderia sp. SFA1]